MKRYNYYIYNVALACLMALGATSCEDFLTLYPQDRVVEENFWEDKNDLEGVRYGAYQHMAGTVEKLIVWGDIRSDAYAQNDYSDQQKQYDLYKKIVEAQLDSTMDVYDWGEVYRTINYCNKVLSHGEQVLERDAQFTRTEWEQMKAEMTAMRALNYFYLLRAFKNIPYSNEVINSDADTHPFTATKQMDVLDILINDVRSVAGKGRNRYTAIADTRGLMTNTAIYALLAEMYLWRSALREGRGCSEDSVRMDADSVVYYGQLSLDALALQNQQLNLGIAERTRNLTDDFGSGLKNAQLLKNEGMENSYNAKMTVSVASYNEIFGNSINSAGNSDESIFELQYDVNNLKNKFVNSFWGHSDATHFATSYSAMSNILGNNFDKDSRMWYTCARRTTDNNSSNDEYKEGYMLKYSYSSFRFVSGIFKSQVESDEGHNWIFYRMTDVMLMMAEAEAVRGNFQACRNIVDAIHKRASLDQRTGLSANSDNNKDKCIDLVMKERLLELAGEGKRWFDLVRYAERIGGGHNADPFEPEIKDGADGVAKMIDNYLGKGSYGKLVSVLKNRIKNRYGLYNPIYYMELRANKYLFPQNPTWNREKGLIIGSEE